jgi:mannose-6-phosphate isomerase-like protein (cupin superfamily)
MNVKVLRQDELPLSKIAHELVGADHDIGVCIIFVDAPPGRGPALHKHPYEEIFIVLEGEASFRSEDDELDVRAGDVVIVPAETPHAFTSSAEGHLWQIDIHVNPTFDTEWLE